MNLLPTFHAGLLNAWWLTLPLVLPAAFICTIRKDVARRMSDMTGYDIGERFFTVSASLAPYLFIIAASWTPFTTFEPALYSGLAVYAAGAALYFATLRAFVNTPPEQPFSAGPFRISRNPLYVAATLMFLGICVTTMNLLLFAWLVVMCIPQHFMILAEERVCRAKYRSEFDRYMDKMPRYLLL